MEIFNTAPLSLPRLPDKARVTLLALGDVGSTLLMGLRLLGGDVISSLGICDVRENVASRWEFELDQIAPPEGGPLPEADVIDPEQLFDGDVFLFCASRMIPDTSVVQGDVRMAQYALNRELVGHYARMAREKQYRGLFVVVHANLEMRKLGFKPYVAPALSSGALTLLALLRRQWHYASLYDGRVFMGCRSRLTDNGPETEHIPLPPALAQRLADTRAKLDAIE